MEFFQLNLKIQLQRVADILKSELKFSYNSLKKFKIIFPKSKIKIHFFTFNNLKNWLHKIKLIFDDFTAF